MVGHEAVGMNSNRMGRGLSLKDIQKPVAEFWCG